MRTFGYIVLGLGVFLAGVAIFLFAPGPSEDIGEIRFGFVRSLTLEGGPRITFDEARWLTGTEGENAAIAAGECSEERRSECLPNGFYILNAEPTLAEYPVADEAVIAMMTLTMESSGVTETQITVEEFAQLINGAGSYWDSLPYQMLVDDGVVRIIEEVYVP